MFNLTTNYFELFGLQPCYKLDFDALKASYLQLQKQVHPDNFAADSEQVQREAVQRVSYLNEAYASLKSPMKRAIYLLESSGHYFDPNTQIHSDAGFLMEQMSLREALSEASEADEPLALLDQLRQRANEDYAEYQDCFARLYDEQSWDAAAAEVNKMMFAAKLLSEISEKEETLFD